MYIYIYIYIYIYVFMYRATSKQIEKCFQIVVDDIFTTDSQVSDCSFFLGLLYKDMHTHIYIYMYIDTYAQRDVSLTIVVCKVCK